MTQFFFILIISKEMYNQSINKRSIDYVNLYMKSQLLNQGKYDEYEQTFYRLLEPKNECNRLHTLRFLGQAHFFFLPELVFTKPGQIKE